VDFHCGISDRKRYAAHTFVQIMSFGVFSAIFFRLIFVISDHSSDILWSETDGEQSRNHLQTNSIYSIFTILKE